MKATRVVYITELLGNVIVPLKPNILVSITLRECQLSFYMCIQCHKIVPLITASKKNQKKFS